jgi:hypothetical protein
MYNIKMERKMEMFLLKSIELKKEIEQYRIQLFNLSGNQKLTDSVFADISKKLNQKTEELQQIIKFMMA